MTEERSKSLDYLQGIISSMRECSFKCKEFSILICSAFLTLFGTVNPTPKIMVLLCSVVLCIFWFFDSFYLCKEKLFIEEFQRISKMSEEEEEKANPLLFSAKPGFKQEIKVFLKSAFASVSTIVIYLPLVLTSGVFGILLLLGRI